MHNIAMDLVHLASVHVHPALDAECIQHGLRRSGKRIQSLKASQKGVFLRPADSHEWHSDAAEPQHAHGPHDDHVRRNGNGRRYRLSP